MSTVKLLRIMDNESERVKEGQKKWYSKVEGYIESHGTGT
jgi:hypothetical protein